MRTRLKVARGNGIDARIIHQSVTLHLLLHMQKAFCCSIFFSASRQMRTAILLDFSIAMHYVYLFVSELNNTNITVQDFFQQLF